MRWLSDRALKRLRRVTELPDLTGTRYRLVEEVGRGGMGTVYLAEDTPLARRVALKILDKDRAPKGLSARLLTEARVLARLEHPGIVPVHDVGELDDGRVFYTMKYVRGRSLDQHLDESLFLAERLRIFVRICEAVAFAHAHQVLHRDLKPENIMVGPFGEVLVMDWGVAKLLNEGSAAGVTPVERLGAGLSPALIGGPPATAHGVVLGTPGYMAPEQARGEVDSVDQRSDVYALGAVLQFLLTGQIPSEAPTAIGEPGSDGAVGARDAGKAGPPRQLMAVADKAMAQNPDDRYDSAEELAAEIQRFIDGRPLVAFPEGPMVRVGRFLSRHRVAVILLLTYVIVRALVIIFSGR